MTCGDIEYQYKITQINNELKRMNNLEIKKQDKIDRIDKLCKAQKFISQAMNLIKDAMDSTLGQDFVKDSLVKPLEISDIRITKLIEMYDN